MTSDDMQPRRAHTVCARLRPYPAYALAALTLVFYASRLPSSVQALDTGELVLAAWGHFVAHPPGYPLYLWLTSAMIFALPFGSVFWRASTLSACLAASVIFALCRIAQRPMWAMCMCILPLIVQPLFWRYALLPDVFMLNAALAIALAALTRPRPTTFLQLACVSMLFGVGVTNHQTLIFCAPLVLWHMHRYAGDRPSAAVVGASVLGAAAFGVSNLSLLWLYVDDTASWGSLHTLSDLARHILRLDYGLWRLSPRDVPSGAWTHPLLFIRTLVTTLPVAAFLAIASPYRIWAHRRREDAQHALVLWATWAGYILIFLPMTNTAHPDVLERFYLMPLVWAVLLAILGLQIARQQHGKRLCNTWLARGAALGALLVACSQFLAHHDALDLRHETIVEDYAINVLQSLSHERAQLVLMHGDTRLHALRYTQRVLGLRPDVIVLSRTALMPGSPRKLFLTAPALKIPDLRPQADEAAFVQALFELNYAHFDIVVADTRGLQTAQMRVSFTGLARRLTPGVGLDVDWPRVSAMQRRSTPDRLGSPVRFREEFDLFAAYAYPYLVAALQTSDIATARKYLQSALLLVPYCLPAHYELCLREAPAQEAACQARMQRLGTLFGDYF